MGAIDPDANGSTVGGRTQGGQPARRTEQAPVGTWGTNGLSGSSASDPEHEPGDGRATGVSLNRSIHPDVTRPLTLLVAGMEGGAFVVQGYPSGALRL
jgi:hypothetical protein